MYSTRTATVTVTYVDTLTKGGRVVCHSYCNLRGYSDIGGRRESPWKYMYSTCTTTVTVTYADTPTEGAMHSVCGYSVT